MTSPKGQAEQLVYEKLGGFIVTHQWMAGACQALISDIERAIRQAQAETWRETIQFVYDACHQHGWDADQVMRECEQRAKAAEGEP